MILQKSVYLRHIYESLTCSHKTRNTFLRMYSLLLLIGVVGVLPHIILSQSACGQGVTHAPFVLNRSLSVELNRATSIETGPGLTDVFIANPDIADIQSQQGKGVFIYGKKPGLTSLYLSYEDGRSVEVTVEVMQNISQLRRLLQQAYPQETITIVSSPKGMVLMGEVSSSKILHGAEELAKQFVKTKDTVVNNMTLSSSNQVYLKVRIAEVSRNVLSKINPGLNVTNTSFGTSNFAFAALTGRDPVANVVAGGSLIARPAQIDSVAGSLGLRFKDSVSDHTGIFDLLDQEGLGTILAEPNLVALSGQKASFLVGGEISYPVPQDNQNVTIEFKPYGISLEFTPTVLSPDLINLRVTPEVSELDDTRTSVFNVQGQSVTVPSIRTRRADTSVELSSGQSFAIAGLMSHSAASELKEVPGLSKLPIIGSLLTSTQFRRNETELVIIVTPYLVQPTQPKNMAIPNKGIIYAHTAETLFTKKLNKKPTGQMHTMAGLHTD